MFIGNKSRDHATKSNTMKVTLPRKEDDSSNYLIGHCNIYVKELVT